MTTLYANFGFEIPSNYCENCKK